MIIKNSVAVIAILLLMSVLVGCVSRYRLDLFLVEGEAQRKVKIESTDFIQDALLSNPAERDKVVPGAGHVMVLTTGLRGFSTERDAAALIGYDVYLRYQVYIQLPGKPQPGTIELKHNSFVQLLGEYDRPADEKIYHCTAGVLAVDSLTDKYLFATIDGSYANIRADTIGFDGNFRIKIAR